MIGIIILILLGIVQLSALAYICYWIAKSSKAKPCEPPPVVAKRAPAVGHATKKAANGWSAERRAKYAQSIAKRAAQKQQAQTGGPSAPESSDREA